jgi:hypothetical protein
VDAGIQGTAALVEIKTTGGVTHMDRRLAAKGDAADPLSRAEIQGKLRTAAKGVIADAAVDRIIALVEDLEHLRNVSELWDAVRA